MHRRLIAGAVVAAAFTATFTFGLAPAVHAATPGGGTSQGGFTAPVAIPSSSGLGEPTLVRDSANRLFVTAPQSLGNVNTAGGSPMWTSTDLGKSWAQPVSSQGCTGLSGGDTDLVADGGDNIFQTDLWLGNSCLSVSEDHGGSFTAGNPYGTHVQPGDDRPWLAYNAISNQLYATYDGLDAVHVANSGPLVNPGAGLQAVQDVPAIPESVVSGSVVPSSVRACVCPPGGIAVDNSTGAHSGRVYVSYSYQQGMAISYTDLVGTCPACTASPNWTGPVAIPNSGGSGSAFEDEWNFAPVKVDSRGTVYVMWAHAPGFDTSANTAPHGVVEQYAFSKDGGTTWTGPFTLSTEGGTTSFPTLDVVSPGVIDAAWYGTDATGDPNTVPATASWSVYYTRVTGADTATPSLSTPLAAVLGIHNGCIQTGGGKACSDRSLLDFFQLADTTDGSPNIIYTAGDATNGVSVWFTRQQTSPASTVPEAPLAALLLPVAVGTVAGVRRRRVLSASKG